MSTFDRRRDGVVADQDTILGAMRAKRPEVARIGKTITIRGDLSGAENLLIDGSVEGTVEMKNNDLTISQWGRVTASIRANAVRIEGEARGDITADEKVVITQTGRVFGNVVAPRVTLEDGAKFEGRIDTDPGAGADAMAPEALRVLSAGQPPVASGPPSEARVES